MQGSLAGRQGEHVPNVLIAIAGAARTFTTIFPIMHGRFIKPFALKYRANPAKEPPPDIFFYLKTEDEGNVNQGMNHRYPDPANTSWCPTFASPGSTLKNLTRTVRRYNFTRAIFVDGANEYSGEALQARMHMVLRPGTWYYNSTIGLHGGLQMAFTLQRVAEFVREMERARGSPYEWVVWLRPDLKTGKRPRLHHWKHYGMLNLSRNVYTIGGLRNWTTLRDYGILARGSVAADVLAGMNKTFEEGLSSGASTVDGRLDNEALLEHVIQVQSRQPQLRFHVTGSLIRPWMIDKNDV